MGRYYQSLDAPHFDYDLQRLPNLGRSFRGPAVDLSRPYIACIGAAQTFGRFCRFPYPVQLTDMLNIPSLNLGVSGAGPRFFLKAEYLAILNTAPAVVVQVMSGRSESNPLFDTSATGTHIGIRRSDGKEMRFEAFYEELKAREDRPFVDRIVGMTQENYVQNSIRLLKAIRPPTVLLWLSTRFPDERAEPGAFPQLVTRGMMERIVPHATAAVECVSADGLPQRLWPAAEEIDGTSLENGYLVNHYYPSQEMHTRAAMMLALTMRDMVT